MPTTPSDTGARRFTELLAKIEAVLLELRAGIREDGGDLQVVEVSEEGHVALRLLGRHACCPIAIATLQSGIGSLLRERVTGITGATVTGQPPR